ncbi:TIGR03085 family protein [Nakamurella panacisegetis]|uniref:TIGR03085 family protein n=1 Tax=Nakamurella panacisegetis TaxID=1090615 RepID=A0A1H0SIB6_9ACTN|nr:TIGR03085 family metal-binding protein [Nakamurella panacisegetis]SDP41494.1 TIGR03085 family protein [Nakamurella panacisegetis]
MTLARTERSALADLLTAVGPDRPTLCQGWTTADLLAHLLVRERRVGAALGIFVPPLAGWTARVSDEYRRLPWNEQVELLRSGPPAFSPLSWGSWDEKANGLEMFIHHEDVRRGEPGWEPRELGDSDRTELIRALTSSFVLRGLKKKAVPITARLTDEPGSQDRPIVLVPSKDTDVAEAPPGVVVRGGVAEILLWLSGRTQVRLEFEGDPELVAEIKR